MNKKIVILLLVIFSIVSLLIFSSKEQDIEDIFPEIRNEIDTYVSDVRRIETENIILALENDLPAVQKSKKYAHLVQIALNYKLLGNKELTHAYLLDAVKEDPLRVNAYIEFGKIYTKDGQIDVAENMYQKVVELEPESPFIHIAQIEFYIQYYPQRDTHIQELFNRARQLTGENEQILLLYANWLEEQEEFIRAIDIYRFVLNRDQDDPYSVVEKIEELFLLVTE